MERLKAFGMLLVIYPAGVIVAVVKGLVGVVSALAIPFVMLWHHMRR